LLASPQGLDGLGSCRQLSAAIQPLTALLPACRDLWLARYFKGYFVGGSIREVKDILLSEHNGKDRSKDNRLYVLYKEKRARARL
jgi:hypothetical protein